MLNVFLQSDNYYYKMNIINRVELDGNIYGYVVCSWSEVKQMAGMKKSNDLPVQFKPVRTFVKQTNFAQIAEFILSLLNKNCFKSILCHFIYIFSVNKF